MEEDENGYKKIKCKVCGKEMIPLCEDEGI